MAAWLSYPLPPLDGFREFSCMDSGFMGANCTYYQERWHFWYIADWVYALPTVAFFMCGIGIFIIGNTINQVLSHTRGQPHPVWGKLIAGSRYLSYRGFYVSSLRWNSAPIGLLLLGAIGAIFFLLMTLVPQPYYWPDLSWGGSPPLGTRSGWMALACMPFVFATASKANWITLVTGVSHERLQTFHRWIAYAFLILALFHTFPFIVYHIHNGDMVMQVTQMNTFEYWTGIVALIFQAWLTFASHSFFRKMNYELFKFSHFTSAVVFMIIFFWHCNATLTSWNYFVATAAIYVSCIAYSWLRTVFEYGGWQDARLTIEDNGFIRIDVPANFDWIPGQHCFLRFGRFGIRVLSSHPFTICSLPSESPNEQSTLTFYVRAQHGFTRRLFKFAQKLPGATVPVLVDGPYGGIDLPKLLHHDRSIVVAGGSGAGWALSFIELFARRALAASLAPQPSSSSSDLHVDEGKLVPRTFDGFSSLRVILATRDSSTRVWFRQAVDEILRRLSGSHDLLPNLGLEIYLTGEAERHADAPEVLADLKLAPSSSSEVDGEASSTDGEMSLRKPRRAKEVAGDEAHGRPHLPTIVQVEAERAGERRNTLGVYVCGPETMQNDARNAAAQANLGAMRRGWGGVYLHLEHFSWA